MKFDDDEDYPLAHSAPREGIQADPYARHVVSVRKGALERAERMLSNAATAPKSLLETIEAAATFHDLGKLDPDVQAALRKGRGGKLKWDHIDAGVAELRATGNFMAAWLVRAHHAPGLPQEAEHFDPDGLGRRLRGRRRDDEPKERHDEQIARTDSMLSRYVAAHEAAVGNVQTTNKKGSHGLTMRLALSCLVDADHTDTAFYDTGRLPEDPPESRWDERLEALCAYVRGLPTGESDAERERNQRRAAFFDTCLNSAITDSVVACEGAVGLGKTTAVAAYLIRRARDEGLRHLFIVAPFTNILTQTARVLRKAVVLEGEDADQVVVEHHHRADFSAQEDRELAVLWRAPIILTTAVSFFETLSACDPASLRKFHEVPGSAVFLDEAHAALPTKLWPQNWKWVCALADRWGCRFVFASGSLARFWENGDIVHKPKVLPDLFPSDHATNVLAAEQIRIRYQKLAGGQVLSVMQLIEYVKNEGGPRLVILNTVQNAAIVAKIMRDAGLEVLHLSTALTPRDRERILKHVDQRLQNKDDQDWVLVATSCVEAGVDLSFRCAFRERFSTSSIIQVGGRVKRHGDYAGSGPGMVYDFALDGDGITQHPAANISADVLRELMNRDTLNSATPADVVTEAMRKELSMRGGLGVDPLVKAEDEKNYPAVKKHGRVIEGDTRFVVVEPELRRLLSEYIPVDFRTLLNGSVQLWSTRIDKLRLEPLPHRGGDIFVWKLSYDPDFLGYMQGVLEIDEFTKRGGGVI